MVQWPHSWNDTHDLDGSRDGVIGKDGLVTATTRLVYVGSDDPIELMRVVRHCSKGGIGYLALSYYNGLTPKDAPWQYTSKTKAQFEESLPLAGLPQTLYDAVMWTRRLGERFILIDSLCIT